METLNCIINEKFDLNLIFENDFFQDEYILESDIKASEIKKTKYNIKKNNKFIGSIFMENNNLNEFMNNFMDIIDDYDVKKLYDKNIKANLSEHYNNFINLSENYSKKNPKSLMGEIYKMRRVAGLI